MGYASTPQRPLAPLLAARVSLSRNAECGGGRRGECVAAANALALDRGDQARGIVLSARGKRKL